MPHPLPPAPATLLANPVRALLAALLLATGLVVAAAPAHADKPYPGSVSTSCTVTLEASGARRLTASVGVGVTGGAPVDGTLTAVFSGPRGQMASRTVDYQGGAPVVLEGPKAAEKGTYVVTATFEPRSGSVFSRCTDSDGVDVGVAGQEDETDDEADTADNTGDTDSPGVADGGQAVDDSDAVLPDTGGPSSWLVVLAAVLLLLGGGLLVAGRRRRTG